MHLLVSHAPLSVALCFGICLWRKINGMLQILHSRHTEAIWKPLLSVLFVAESTKVHSQALVASFSPF